MDIISDIERELKSSQIADGIYKYERGDGYFNVFEVVNGRIVSSYLQKDGEKIELIPNHILRLYTTQNTLIKAIFLREKGHHN